MNAFSKWTVAGTLITGLVAVTGCASSEASDGATDSEVAEGSQEGSEENVGSSTNAFSCGHFTVTLLPSRCNWAYGASVCRSYGATVESVGKYGPAYPCKATCYDGTC